MKRIIIAILFSLSALVWPASAQEPEPYRLFLPLVMRSDMPILCTKPWRLIEPEASSNLVLNPSGEIAGNFAAAGGGAATRVATFSHYGLDSYRVQTAANGQGISLTTGTLGATVHFVTLRVHGTLPPAWRVGIGAASKAPREIEKIDPEWTLYGVAFSAAEASAAVAVTVTQSGAGAGDFYIDGIQVEALGHWTSYIDGTQAGCAWAGAAHASSSERSGQSRVGGQLLDLWDEYKFFTEEMIGVGAAPLVLDVRNYAILPGGELSGQKIEPRQFTLIGRFIAHSEEELHDRRKALIKVLSSDTYAEFQPVRLRFDGARVQKTIDAYYQGGLEAELPVTYGTLQTDGEEWRMMQYWTERVSIQFLAPDPMWYEIGESSVLLDTNDSATFRVVTSRLIDTGQWDELGPPNAAGTYTNVRAIAEDGTYIYFGGDFLNFNNIANADYIVRYNKQTGAYLSLGTGMNGIVRALIIAPNGNLFACGFFTTAGGGGANRIAEWNGAAWSALGTGLNALASSLAIGLDGILYVGGSFTSAGGVPVDEIASWDGTTWADLVSNFNAPVHALAIGLDGTLFVGGEFTEIGGAPGNRIAEFDPDTSVWSAMGDGIGTPAVTALAVHTDGRLYIGGNFLTPGNRVAVWNGTSYETLGDGTNQTVFSLSIGPDGFVYIGGNFTEAGGITLTDRVAKWNGASWAHLDMNFPGSAIIYSILASKIPDPVVTRNYDLWLGFDTIGTGNFAGIATVTNDGAQPNFPKFIVTRSGGTSAILEELRNETTGKELLFDYGLLDGETLTIDLTPTNKSIISSMFGSRLDAVFANSDFGTWSLQPDDNEVTVFVNVAGGPTVTAWMLWKDTYRSLD